MQQHHTTGFSGYSDLKDSLRSYFSKKVLAKACVLTRHKNKDEYSLRTIRAYRATEWVKLVMQSGDGLDTRAAQSSFPYAVENDA